MAVIDAVLSLLLLTLLGLLVAFSPMILIVNLLVVLKSTRPILKTLVLMAGMALPILIVGILAINFIDPDTQISLGSLSKKINVPPLIDIALGVWLLAWAQRRIRFSRTHKKPRKPTDLIMKNPPDKLVGLFTFAFIKSALSVTNIFAILAVGKLIVTNSINQPLSTLVILWVLLVGLIPFGVILYFYFFKHERLDNLSDQVDRLLNRNLDRALNLALLTAGFFFLFIGLINLLSEG